MLAQSKPQALTSTQPDPDLCPALSPYYHPPEARSCVPRPRDHATSKAAKRPATTATANFSINSTYNRRSYTAFASNQSRRPKDHPHHRHKIRPYPHDSLPQNFATLIAITSIPPLKNHKPHGRTRPHQTLGSVSDLHQTEISEKVYDYAPPTKDHLEILLRPSHGEFNLNRDYDIEPVPSLSSSLSTQDSSTPAIQKLSADDLFDRSIPTPEYESDFCRASWRLKPRSCRLEYCLPTHHPLSDLEVDGKTATASSSKSQVTPLQNHSLVQHEPKTKSTLCAPFRAMKAATKKLTFFPSFSSTSCVVPAKPSLRHTYTAALMAEDLLKSLQDTSTPTFSKYSNPFRHDPLEEYFSMPPSHKIGRRLCISSIQLQTYSTSRYPRRTAKHPSNQRTKNTAVINTSNAEPFVRPREMRENGDFMRVAVMEMLMRKRGKLDRQSPGRARMALPPRKVSTEAYKITSDGIPIRWIPISGESVV